MEQKSKHKPGLRDYWQIFLRRKWLIILPIIAIVSIAIPGSFLLPPVYQASTTLISQEMERGSILSGVPNVPVPPDEQIDTIRTKIGSRTYIREIASRVGVAEYLRSIGKPPSDDEDVVRYLRGIVTVQARRGRIVQISVEHPIPAMAKDIADSVANVYVERTLRWRQNTTSETTDFIKQQMDFYWQRLSEAEEALVEAQEKSPLGYLSEEADSLVSEAAKLKTELFEIELDLREAKSELQKARELSDDDLPESYVSALYIDPEVARLQAELAGLQTRYAQLSMKYSDQYPEVRKLRMDIEQTQEKLDQAKARFRVQQQNAPERIRFWQDRIKTLEVKKTALDDKTGEYDRRLQLLPQRQLELARLQREKSIAESTYSMLLQRLNTLELLQTSELYNVGPAAEVLDPAIEPDRPVKPDRKKIAFLAVAMGMVMGFGSAFLLEYFDRSLRSVDEVADYLGVPVLAAIPRLTTFESEVRERRSRRVKIACMVSLSLLALILIADVVSAELLTRDSFSLNIARRGLNFLKMVILRI